MADAGAGTPPDPGAGNSAPAARASAVLAAGTAVSRVLGFARTWLLVLTIGASTNIADAFGVANQLPNTMYQLTAGGILTAVLVPQIVQATRSSDRGTAYINRISTLAILLFTIAAAALTAASPLLIRLYTHGWSGERVAIATAMAFLCMPQVFFYGLYALLGGVLNARNVFGPFTWAPVLNNVIAIAGLGVFLLLFGADGAGVVPLSDWTGPRIGVLAGSATLGVAAQALILFVFWRRAGIRFRPDFTFRGVGLGATFVAASWILGNVVVETLVGLVQSNVLTNATATRAQGDVSLVGNNGLATVFLLFALPHSIIAVSIATVYYTRLSEHWATHRLRRFRGDFSRAARLIGVASVIATALLIVLSFPIVRLFSTGAYAETAALAWVLIALSTGLVGYSFFFLTMRALFSVDATRSVFVVNSASAVCRVVGAAWAIWLDPHLTVIGIALANAVAMWVEAIAGFVVLRRKVGPPGGFLIVRTHIRLGIAALVAGIGGAACVALLGGYAPTGFGLAGKGQALLTLSVAGILMLVLYLAATRLLRVREIEELVALVRARLGR